jgi:hypothetical protein
MQVCLGWLHNQLIGGDSLMTLSISRNTTLNGSHGTRGSHGANGTAERPNGVNGTAGTDGESVTLAAPAETFLGDAGNDRINLSAYSRGGDGDIGGLGGSGAGGSYVREIFHIPDVVYEIIDTWTPGGNGGDGGAGGTGGDGSTLFEGLVAALGAGLNALDINANARGGNGAGGGSANRGGDTGVDGFREIVSGCDTDKQSVFRGVNVGNQGGFAGLAGEGGDGGDGIAAIRDLEVSGGTLTMYLTVNATGGRGDSGGYGGVGGQGARGAPGSDGGQSGDGGDALAELSGLNVHDVAAGSMTINLFASGGSSARGGHGQASSRGLAVTQVSDCGGYVSSNTSDWEVNGAGGKGGDGGDATARFVDSTMFLGNGQSTVQIAMQVAGGFGAIGGSGGGAFVPDFSEDDEGQLTVVYGKAAGLPGAPGIKGLGTLLVENVVIDLGGGDDTLTFNLRPGAEGRVKVSGNSFAGGDGIDTLQLGTVNDGVGAFVNLKLGTLKLGYSPVRNQITGFEIVIGTHKDDVFRDGAGNQTYDGNGGADLFIFRAGHGKDVIRGFGADEELSLRGFGPALDEFADVLAATIQTAQGALIDTGGGNTILLQHIAKSALTADMFSFG